jgi:hypothetical protein
MKDKKEPKNCRIKNCKNIAGINTKTGNYYDICDFHFQENKKNKTKEKDKSKKQDDQKKKEIKSSPTSKHFERQERSKKIAKVKPKDWVEETYDPNYKLVTNVGGAFFINHPKKIRYIRIESRPSIEKSFNNSVIIKSGGKKVLELPFDTPESQEKAFGELKEVIGKLY